MHHRIALLFMLALLLTAVGCGGPASLDDLAAARAKVTSYEMTLSGSAAAHAPAGSQLVKLEAGQVVKMKMTMPRGWTLIDRKAKVTYAMMGGMCMKMPQKEGQDGLEGVSPQGLKATGTVVGSETVDGVVCSIVEATDGGTTSKSWIGVDGLARKVQTGDRTMTMTYTRVNAVPDSEFELPPGTQVKDMGALMQGLQKLGR